MSGTRINVPPLTLASSPDLVGGSIADIQAFMGAVASVAVKDHLRGPRRMTGGQLCAALASNWRLRHERLASTIYNQLRDECVSRDNAR